MTAQFAGSKRRWAASAVGALAVVAAMVSLWQIPASGPGALAGAVKPTPARGRWVIQLTKPAETDQKVSDETLMHDQTPLFLPTARNVAMRPPRRPEAGRAVLDQDVSHNSFTAGELRLNLPPPETVPEQPAEVLLAGAPAIPLYGFGKGGATPEAPLHGAVVEILSLETNRRVMPPVVLEAEARPPTERSWRPLVFLARVNAAGLAGPLTIVNRSDVEEVDKFFRNYLGETFRIWDRLPPGSYRVIVGP